MLIAFVCPLPTFDPKIFVEKIMSKEPDVVIINGVPSTSNMGTLINNIFRTTTYKSFRPHNKAKTYSLIYAKDGVSRQPEHILFTRTSQSKGITQILYGPVILATASFEEGGSGRGFRKYQMAEVKNISNHRPYIFACNTHIPIWQNSMLELPHGWYDTWEERGTAANELTNGDDRSIRVLYTPAGIDLRCISYDTISIGCTNKVVMCEFLLPEEQPKNENEVEVPKEI